MILLVDGDEDRRGVERFRLCVWGYRLIEAASIEEARGIVESRRDAFALQPGALDLVLLRPEDGIELAGEMERRYPMLPFLVLTGEAIATGIELRARVKWLMRRNRGAKPRVLSRTAQAAVDHARESLGRKPPHGVRVEVEVREERRG